MYIKILSDLNNVTKNNNFQFLVVQDTHYVVIYERV